MVRLRALALLFLVLSLPLPTAVAGASAIGVAAQGPAEDGSFSLLYDVEMTTAASVAVALHVLREDADGTLAGARDLGTRELAAGSTRLNLSFLPGEGAGQYTVGLVLDGIRAAELSFAVEDATSSRTVGFDIPDEPTYLNLTAEDVNADGKLKSPGEALITRAQISDRNGLADVDGVLWRVERAGVASHEAALVWAPGDALTAGLEVRFDRAPIAAGNHTMRLVAHRGGVEVAATMRTFAIREVAPTLAAGALVNVTPDEIRTQDAFFVLADKNGMPNGTMEARVYRGSTRVESAGFSATLGAPMRGEDVDGAARITYPLTLVTPTGAAAGSYRVSLYHDSALVGSLPFDVLPLPTLRNVNATALGNSLRLDVEGSGDGILAATLSDANGTAANATAPLVNGSAALTLPAPRQGTSYAWTLTLRAREDGPTLETRTGNWTAPLDGAPLRVTPLFVRSRLPASWTIDADRDMVDASPTWRFTRWDGVDEPRLVGQLNGSRARVSSPTDLPAGRYTALLRVDWPDGSASEASWSFDAGPWVELALGEPVVSGREARISVRNAGGIAVERLIVESDPLASLELRIGNASHQPTPTAGRSQFHGAPLAPGEEAELVVRLPEGALRSGRHDVPVRVLAKVALG